MRWWLVLPVSVLILRVVAGCGGQDSERIIEAKGAAESVCRKWLQLVDRGDYARSYQFAAGHFKYVLTKEQYAATLREGRESFGGLVGRERISALYKTDPPRAPKGEYVIIHFKVSFESGETTLERVSVIKEKDNTWKVAGYHIK